ncbi:Hypothetical predicted protein [Podarcis lilfordi]|nr:Hypothetical predicted protein [Podarcis lilfordi]
MKMAVHNLYSAPAGSLPVVKIPKKRGRKPGYKLKSRVLMTPLAISPPRSTPEPDISSIPQDAATIPNSAAPQALTVCIYVNKQANVGPYLERKKVQQLPDHFGPERPSMVLQQAVQACIDCAHQQKTVFSLVKQGYGGEMVSVSASFDGKQHLLSLPVVNSIGYVLRFLKKLCRSLLCDNLFSNQPFPQYNTAENPEEYENGRMESANTAFPPNHTSSDLRAQLRGNSFKQKERSAGEKQAVHTADRDGLQKKCQYHPAGTDCCVGYHKLGQGMRMVARSEHERGSGDPPFNAEQEWQHYKAATETVIPEDYLVDPVNTKHYSVDPSDSAFNCMGSVYSMRQSSGDGRHGGGSSSSCSHRSGQMASGGPSAAALRHQTSSPTRNGTYMEGNRSGNILHSIFI